MGGHVHGAPLLLTAQGTIADMRIRPGARYAASMDVRGRSARAWRARQQLTPLSDLQRNGIDVLMWGERAIALEALDVVERS